ncbi:MAG TPA: hypothetical protein VHF05_01105 [Candidatus Paceibacterota bacterium]|jgi:hypothetical protein|nr:hypothetical protein [Candidatus Paceibacterota bacterium]
MKKIFITILVLVIAGIGIYFYMHKNGSAKNPGSAGQTSAASFDGRNSTFAIDGNPVTLADGISEVPIPDSSSKVTTRYFGNEAAGDLDGDGTSDMAFIVTQDSGGSGLFYYAVAALHTSSGWKTTNAYLIGDRIAPQSTVIPANSLELEVNYADRDPNEPMSTAPSQAKTLTLKVAPGNVLEPSSD